MTRTRALMASVLWLAAAILDITAIEAAAAVAPIAPTTVRATYRVYKAGIWIGTVEESFTRDGDNYKIVSDTDTAGPLRLFLRDHLTVTSEGTVDRDGLKPRTYHFTRRNDQKKNISAQFDWDKQQIASRHTDVSELFDLPVGTQDRISAMYQFMFSPPSTDEVSVSMSQGKKAERYRYRKQGEVALLVNQESLPAVYYARDAKVGESKAHLWLARTKYYLPIKIVFEDANGGSLEQILVTLQTE